MDLKKFHSVMKDDIGRYRTQSLFWELRYGTEEKFPPIFTLKSDNIERDGKLYYSLKKIYLSYDHVPKFEYEFATDVFGSWDHWNKLANDTLPAIKDEIKSWREELDIKLKALGLKALIHASRDNDAKGVQASKYLAEKGYEVKRGRPSKAEIEAERKQAAGVKKELASDMERIGLAVVGEK
jgi:hypothetical protein